MLFISFHIVLIYFMTLLTGNARYQLFILKQFEHDYFSTLIPGPFLFLIKKKTSAYTRLHTVNKSGSIKCVQKQIYVVSKLTCRILSQNLDNIVTRSLRTIREPWLKR